jgi:hypothetical protein
LKHPLLVAIGESDDKEFLKLLKEEEKGEKETPQIILAFWLCCYLEKYDKVKKILAKYPDLKTIFKFEFKSEKEFVEYVIDLQLFGRKSNGIVFEIALKQDEEYLAM